MTKLTERQKLVLALIVKDYIKTAQPVGSQYLVNQYGLNFSSATVRNEMAVLSDLGFLLQPYTSAGRAPTKEGYRYFVQQLMSMTELPHNVRRMIRHQFYQAGKDIDAWMRLAVSILAQHSNSAAIATTPHSEDPKFKHLELISTRTYDMLLILVLGGGEVRQRFLGIEEEISQDELSLRAGSITQHLLGKNIRQITHVLPRFDQFDQMVITSVIDNMKSSTMTSEGDIYKDGLDLFLAEPEFSEVDLARKALKLVEERAILEDLLNQSGTGSQIGGVQVIIGGEGTWEELSDCSFVVSNYGARGIAVGTLGVLGPIRMEYSHTVSAVSFISRVLTDLVASMHSIR